jgi:hypothetical protein
MKIRACSLIVLASGLLTLSPGHAAMPTQGEWKTQVSQVVKWNKGHGLRGASIYDTKSGRISTDDLSDTLKLLKLLDEDTQTKIEAKFENDNSSVGQRLDKLQHLVVSAALKEFKISGSNDVEVRQAKNDHLVTKGALKIRFLKSTNSEIILQIGLDQSEPSTFKYSSRVAEWDGPVLMEGTYRLKSLNGTTIKLGPINAYTNYQTGKVDYRGSSLGDDHSVSIDLATGKLTTKSTDGIYIQSSARSAMSPAKICRVAMKSRKG